MVKIKRIASQVRAAYEDIAGKDNDLCGYCCRASAQLLLAAQRHGIHGVQIVLGSGHVFNVYDKHIIDVTATQFGVADKVYITPYDPDGDVLSNGWWKTRGGPYNSLDEFEEISGWRVNPGKDISTVLKYDTIENAFLTTQDRI